MPNEQQARLLLSMVWAIETLAKSRLRPLGTPHPAVTVRTRQRQEELDKLERARKRARTEAERVELGAPSRETKALCKKTRARMKEIRAQLNGLLAGEYDWLDLDAIDKELQRIAEDDFGCSVFRLR